MELGQRAVRFSQPTLGPKLLIAAFACEPAQLCPDSRIGGSLVFFKQCNIQMLPRTVEFHQPVGGNVFFLHQHRCRVDQNRRRRTCLSLGDLRFQPLLRFTVNAPIVIAEFAFGFFQRLFARQCLHGGVFDIDEWGRFRHRQQCFIVTFCGTQLFLPRRFVWRWGGRRGRFCGG